MKTGQSVPITKTGKLSQAIVDYLTERGIAADRLESQGYDFSQTILPNNTAEGRTQNCRVEFKILSI